MSLLAEHGPPVLSPQARYNTQPVGPGSRPFSSTPLLTSDTDVTSLLRVIQPLDRLLLPSGARPSQAANQVSDLLNSSRHLLPGLHDELANESFPSAVSDISFGSLEGNEGVLARRGYAPVMTSAAVTEMTGYSSECDTAFREYEGQKDYEEVMKHARQTLSHARVQTRSTVTDVQRPLAENVQAFLQANAAAPPQAPEKAGNGNRKRHDSASTIQSAGEREFEVHELMTRVMTMEETVTTEMTTGEQRFRDVHSRITQCKRQVSDEIEARGRMEPEWRR
ncbi:MAG: hypothetical protein FD120_2794, partial [Gammaproteobacteria bacterium]